MHARASTMTGDPGRVDEAAKLLETELYAQLQQLNGFRGVVALGQRDSGRSLVLTLWDDEAAMSASEEAAKQMRSSAAGQMGASAPEVERYEVLFYRAAKD
jgi:heme-degrading monooxygenase HmoA